MNELGGYLPMTCHLSASHLPVACHFFLKILRLYKDKDKEKDKDKDKVRGRGKYKHKSKIRPPHHLVQKSKKSLPP